MTIKGPRRLMWLRSLWQWPQFIFHRIGNLLWSITHRLF
jgi:hypothetical protein